MDSELQNGVFCIGRYRYTYVYSYIRVCPTEDMVLDKQVPTEPEVVAGAQCRHKRGSMRSTVSGIHGVAGNYPRPSWRQS